jgi:hypothetical protein
MISSPMIKVYLKLTTVDLALRCDEFEHKLVLEMGFEMEIENEVV